MPVNTSPTTVADLIGNQAAYQQQIAADSAAVATASDALKADNAGLQQTNAALGQAVAALGGVFVQNPDGTATAFEPDGSGGTVPKTLKPASTAIPAQPAQAPAPPKAG